MFKLIIEGHELDRFKLLREEIRFEYNLTSSRVSWYVASQAFLVTSFAISFGSQSSSKLKFFLGDHSKNWNSFIFSGPTSNNCMFWTDKRPPKRY